MFQANHRGAYRLGLWTTPACALSMVVAAGALGGPGKRFDPKTGEDPHHYPPDCPVDFRHLKLDLSFEDLKARSFTGRAELTVRPVHEQVSDLALDAVDLQIQSVALQPAREFTWDYDDRRITLHFGEPLPPDADTKVIVSYRCVEPVEGMMWAVPDEHYPDRPLVIHTQGEPEFARFWFPCLDSPVDRCTTEVVATIPSGYTAISNGRLVEKRDGEQAGRTTFHYHQEQPHVFYLVSLVIGKFNEVKDTWRDIDVQYFLPPGKGEFARLTYGRTPEMLEHFSNLLDYDYPYAKYSQVNVPLFMFGGMENTSATTMADTAIVTPRAALDQDLEGLIAHELAHQWFGDLITCRSWEHIWLNEGFATFMASVWEERSKGRDEYLYDFWRRYNRLARTDAGGEGAGLLFSDYRHPFEPFFHKGSLPYTKGSCVLHMLRHQLGDDLFWRAVRAYVERFAFDQAETEDLRRTIEAVTGKNLERFFTQWVSRSGVPQVKVRYTWDSGEKTATVTISQTQQVDRERPAFQFPLDLYFRAGDDEVHTTVDVATTRNVFRRKFDHKPEVFCVDPRAGVLMKLEAEKPKSMWLAQLRGGPTSIARIVAASHLIEFDRPEVVEALRTAAADPEEVWTVRAEAAAALGKMRTERARDALLALLQDEQAVADHKVRAAVIEAAGTYDAPEVGEAIAPFARSDPSSRVEAAATAALGNIRSFNAADILVANAAKDSYQDQIRRAAIRALAERDDRKAFDVAMKYAAYGHHDRLRPTAIRALGRLARDNPRRRDEVRPALVRWLTDPQKRTAWAAIEALADLGDPESTAAIRRLMAGAVQPRTYYLAEDALRRARPESESEKLRALEHDIELLREKVYDLSRNAEP